MCFPVLCCLFAICVVYGPRGFRPRGYGPRGPRGPRPPIEVPVVMEWCDDRQRLTEVVLLLPQGNIEFLVSETPDGKLDLSDTFIFDGGEVCLPMLPSCSMIYGCGCVGMHLYL